ncbi:MAG: ParB/RepB/Spo0J family partition protein [Saprospiraceae bacterium]|nr:ParB/RepB/Spo0J family partition protein [Saprospiraceae bacterium]
MAKVDKQELGKGIRALLGDTAKSKPPAGEDKEQPTATPVREVSTDQIEINPFQPRNEFDQEALEELAESIKTFGLIQPVTLRRLDGSKYQLIAGERRLRASRLAGLKTIPAFIREANDQEMLEMALVENIQRAELNAIEVAISYQRLIDECQLTHEALSDRIGKNRSTVTNYVRLLKLPPGVQQALKSNRISMGHARSLLSIPGQEGQLLALRRVLEEDLSVRATEKLVREFITPSRSGNKTVKPKLPVEYQHTVDYLTKTLGTKVEMKRQSSGSGTLIIHFQSDSDLNEILDHFEDN